MNDDGVRENYKLEAKDVLQNINHTQAAERAEKFRFLSLVTLTFLPLTFTFKLFRARTKHVFLVDLAQIRSAVSDFIHKQENTDGRCQKNRAFAVHCVRSTSLIMKNDDHCKHDSIVFSSKDAGTCGYNQLTLIIFLCPVSTLSFYLLFSFGLLLVFHLSFFFHILCFK